MRQKRIAVIIVTVVLILGLLYNMTSNVNSESNNYGLSNPIVSEENTIWDCIYFGNYLQEDTNNDGVVNEKDEKQPIKWRVLSIDNHSAMLFSDKLLDFKQYEESDNCYGTNASGNAMKEVTWENSTIREWLNNDFYNKAFSKQEQKFIEPISMTSEDGGFYLNKVWLLSSDQFNYNKYGLSSIVNNSDSIIAETTHYSEQLFVNCSEEQMNFFNNKIPNAWFIRDVIQLEAPINLCPPELNCDMFKAYEAKCIGQTYVPVNYYMYIRPCIEIDLLSSTWTKADKVDSYNKIIKSTTEVKSTTTQTKQSTTRQLVTVAKPGNATGNATSKTDTDSTTTSTPTTTVQPITNIYYIINDTTTTQSFKAKDRTKPTIKGVQNKKTYKKSVTIKFSDKSGIKKATLNGKKIKSGKKIKKNGKYTLIVTDKAGNVKKVNFVIKISKKSKKK